MELTIFSFQFQIKSKNIAKGTTCFCSFYQNFYSQFSSCIPLVSDTISACTTFTILFTPDLPRNAIMGLPHHRRGYKQGQ